MNSSCENLCPAAQYCAGQQALFEQNQRKWENAHALAFRAEVETSETAAMVVDLDVPGVVDQERQSRAMGMYTAFIKELVERGFESSDFSTENDEGTEEASPLFLLELEHFADRLQSEGLSVIDLLLADKPSSMQETEQQYEEAHAQIQDSISRSLQEYDMPTTTAACISGPAQSVNDLGILVTVCGSPNLTDRQRQESARIHSE